jgi:hypothetical protein
MNSMHFSTIRLGGWFLNLQVLVLLGASGFSRQSLGMMARSISIKPSKFLVASLNNTVLTIMTLSVLLLNQLLLDWCYLLAWLVVGVFVRLMSAIPSCIS